MKKILLLFTLLLSVVLLAACDNETEVTVTFMLDEDTVYKVDKQIAGNYFSLPDAPEKDGYEFKGWLLNGTGYDINSVVTVSIILMAYFELIEKTYFEISFFDGDASILQPLRIEQGNVIGTLPTYIKDGHTFVGWYLEKDFVTEISNDYVVTGNINLYAKTTENEKAIFTVVFYDGDKEILTPISVVEGDTFSISSYSKEDYDFDGWYLDQNFSTLYQAQPVTSSFALYAKMTPKERFIITFFDGNNEILTPIEVVSGKTFVLPNYQKDNYTFHGWYLDQNFSTPYQAQVVTASLNLYAKTTQNNSGNFPTDYITYYDSAEGLTGDKLKSTLKTIISKMSNYSYSDTSYVLEDADEDINKAGYLYLIYDGKNVKNVWDSASSWNKEHVWPQSKLGGASKSDLHNLRASTPSVNSSRGNMGFVDGTGSYKKIGSGWYPGDDHRGDVARIILYMHVRWGLTISTMGNLDMFIRWHKADPVSEFEIRRNQRIYDSRQNNRNPFIDYPHFVDLIWS